MTGGRPRVGPACLVRRRLVPPVVAGSARASACTSDACATPHAASAASWTNRWRRRSRRPRCRAGTGAAPAPTSPTATRCSRSSTATERRVRRRHQRRALRRGREQRVPRAVPDLAGRAAVRAHPMVPHLRHRLRVPACRHPPARLPAPVVGARGPRVPGRLAELAERPPADPRPAPCGGPVRLARRRP